LTQKLLIIQQKDRVSEERESGVREMEVKVEERERETKEKLEEKNR